MKYKAVFANCARTGSASAPALVLALLSVLFLEPAARAQYTLPVVAVHDSELTRALATMPASGLTPTNYGTTAYGYTYGVTGKQWWHYDWNYFVMPDSVKEMLNSDGTMHTTVSDADIAAGGLLVNGAPKYPIVISLASEAINDNEIATLTNYVAAGGFLFVGSSAFTRNPDGTYRADFAIGPQMGVTMYLSGQPVNWDTNSHMNKISGLMPDHILTSDLPWESGPGAVNWAMPQTDDDTSWGIDPDHNRFYPHNIYLVDHTTSTLLLGGDDANLLMVQQYGKGYFIYYADFEPLIGNGGWAPAMFSYSIFHHAIEWAFQSNQLPIPKVSPWPFAYDAAFTCRHDLENYQSEISHIEASAAIEFTNGVKGDYYFCTGTLRQELANSPAVIAGLQRAVTNYGATIGSHNGGLPNPDNSALVLSDYDYWHWGPDEVLNVTPPGYASGMAYASSSISNSFLDIEGWLAGINTGVRKWVGPYFNSTREPSYQILDQLDVKIAGDQKLSPFPHWTLSTITPDKKYGFLSIAPEEWFIGDNICHCLDSFGGENGAMYDTNNVHAAIDYYYGLGALINLYSHTLATGEGYAGLGTGAGGLVPEYIQYSLNTNLHPRVWSANAQMIYDWWVARSNVQVSVSFTNTGQYQIATAQVSGATRPDTAIELKFTSTNDLSGVSVYTNGVLAGAGGYRINGQIVKVLVGTTVSQVQISLLTSGDTYFVDTFARANDPAPPSPFTIYSGAWTITGGQMLGGPNSLGSYGYAFYTNGTSGWTDYAVEAQLKVPIGAFGGGVGGRLNPATGARYAAWLYPESTPGGAAQLKLLKFNSWTQFSYLGNANVPIVAVPLPSGVGTNSHAVRLAFRGNEIAVFYDDTRMISTNDSEAATYTSGGITLDMYTDTTPYTMAVDQVTVTALVVSDQYTVGVNKVLTVPAPGVLANDSPMVGTGSAALAGNVQHGTLVLNANGSFTYTPATNFSGSDSFIYQASDGQGVMASATATITVTPLHNGPSLPVQTNLVVSVLVPLVVTNTAIDTDIPLPPLTYTLVAGSPTNATISTNGIISWTPAETQAPGTNTITTIVTDGSLSATNSFTVVVNDVNIAPTLPVWLIPFTVGQLKTLVVTNTATETDIHVTSLTYTLLGPTNAVISTNGIITWTPTVAQNATTNLFTTIVTNFDPLAVNAQHLSATNTFTVIVQSYSTIVMAGNTLLTEGCAPTNHVIDPGETVTVLFSLQNTGLGDTANLVATLLQTNGVVYPSTPQSYGVVVAGGAAVVEPFTLSATGACGGTITATFQLQDGAINLGTVSSTFPLGGNGIIFTQNFDTVTAPALPAGWTTTNSGAQPMWFTTNSLADTAPNAAFSADANNLGVNELVSPPITLSLGQSQLAFRNNYALESGGGTNGYDGGVLEIKIGTGAFTDIVTNGGIWVSNGYNAKINAAFSNPLAGRGAWSGTNGGYVTTIVNLPAAAAGQTVQFKWRCGTDNSNGGGGWRIDSIGITGTACCANNAPVLASQPNRTINELTTMVVTNTVVDTGIPASALTYTLTNNPPAGATISTNGVITWTPTQTQSPSTNVFTTVATHLGAPSVSSTNSFTVTVLEVNVAPVLSVIPAQTINELTSLTVTNIATNSNIHSTIAGYTLVNPPAGATISANGVITWTPSQNQSPSTNTITTVVTNSNPFDLVNSHLTATNSFTIVVREVNVAPTLPGIPGQTINELTLLTVTNTASNPNIHSTIASYALVNPPAGVAINASGIITWTPTEAQGPGTYTITTVVTNTNPYDLVSPRLNATNSFTVVVNEINTPPVLPNLPNVTTSGTATVVVTNTATDSDIPVNALNYSFLAAPTNAVINANGIITWTPLPSQVPSTNVFTTIVTDFNPQAVNAQHLSATNTFTIFVNPVHNGPVLPSQPDVSINELTTLVVTNTASDADLPPKTLTYALLGAPAGAAIDSNGIITWTPTEAQGPSTNVITTIVVDNGTPLLSAANSFTVIVNEVNVAPVLPPQTNRTITGLDTLVVTNTATDADIPANSLTYSLAVAPANAAVDTNGIITWKPAAAQVPGTYTFATVVTDYNPGAVNAQHLSATNTFAVQVTAVHNGPSMPTQKDQAVDELTTITVTNSANDVDVPALGLAYALINPPAGLVIDTNGVITWTPTEAQGPSTNLITTVVTDAGTPPLSATNQFNIVVNEVNLPPVLGPQADRAITGHSTLTVTNNATDPDLPSNSISYQLLNAPTGAVIDTNGVITWTPSVPQVPSTNIITTVATDYNPWAVNAQHLSATNSFTVTVNPVHNGPSLAAQTNRTINELTALIVTNSAIDTDVPILALTYTLISPPAGAAIDTNGVISWTPSEAQGPGTNVITTVVTDSGTPQLSATNSFTVAVNEVNTPPILPGQSNRTLVAVQPLVVTNTATDSDIPANTLSYQLVNAPAGAAIDPNGVITWTPTVPQVPGSYTITTIVTDFNQWAVNNQHLTATNSFVVTVNAIHNGPVLPSQVPRTIWELTTLIVTNTAADTDIPYQTLSYSLVGAPAGAQIDTNGVFTWTPTEAQGPSTNTITTLVVDSDQNPLAAVNTFVVTVLESNSPPILPSQNDRTLTALQPLTVTNTASDSDIPTNTLTYQLLNPPTGMVISANGIITWTPTVAQVPSTNQIVTVVTDYNPWAANAQSLSTTNTFKVTVNAIHNGPVLPAPPNTTINELTLLTVTNTASSADVPPLAFAYALVNPPSGAAVDANGVITWTPSEAQGPSTALITTVVTDAGSPAKRATNTFVVTVNEVNSAPVLPSQTNRLNVGLTPMTVTNTASDSDIPVNALNYSLVNPPTGAAINSKGVITWVPTPDEVGQNLVFTTVVTDYNPYALTNQFLSATNSFTVNIAPVHNGPVLPTQPSYTISAGSVLTVTNTATDYDVPLTHLTYLLLPPTISNCSIDANGIITFAPSGLQGNTTNRITTYVYDDSSISLGAQNSFYVTVLESNSPPILSNVADQTVAELTTLTVTNSATNASIHSTILGYGLVNPPTGATIGANGVITWTPSQNQSPGTNTITTVVTNSNPYDLVHPQLTATNSFNVVVREVNVAPTLPVIPTQTVNELTLLTVTNTASNANIHSTILGYGLVNPPAGVTIGGNGVITWTPGQNQSPSTNTLTTVVTNSNPYDSVNPFLTATNSFTVFVREVNVAPTLPVIPTQTVSELTLLTVTNTATNGNIHSTILGYALVNPPTGATIGANGIITWTPSQNQSPSTNTLTTVVTNSNPYDLVSPQLTATNSFTVVVGEVNVAPTLPVIPTQTVNELTLLTVTNTASNANIHSTILGYGLVNPPAGATIGANGVITWTPSQSQSPSTNTIMTVVTNSDPYDLVSPRLTATSSFIVIVREVNVAPTLPVIPAQTVNALTLLTVTNTASNANIHSTIVGYGLVNPPTGATIGANGSITWTPSQNQSASTNTLTTVVTNSNPYDLVSPQLTATNSFTVTVNPALIVTADLQTRSYGAANPTLTGNLVGLQNGDNITPVFSTTADTNSPVGSYTITAALLDPNQKLGNYTVITNNGTLTVTPATLTVTADPKGRPYGAPNPVFTANYSGFINADTTNVLYGSPSLTTLAAQASPVGNYAITAGLGSLSATNYSFSFVAGNLTIAPAQLTVSGITASNKPYDGTTVAAIQTAGAALQSPVPGDDVTLNAAGASGAFGDPALGTNKTVFISGLSLGGSSTNNYSLVQPTATADIMPGGLTVSGIVAVSKVYDGSTNATLILTNAALAGVMSGDDVTLNTTNAVGAFADPTAGTNKSVAVSGLALLGADAGKYTLTQPTTNADITPATLTPSVMVASKVYDGTTAATITNRSLSGIVGSDDVSLGASGSAAFADKNAGTGKPVNITLLSLSGSAATNYVLSASTATANADITPLPITVTADPKTKVFGNPDPVFTYQVSGGSLASGDFFFGSLARVQGENVGAYAILQYNLAAGGNYQMTFVSANLTITTGQSSTAVVSTLNPAAPGATVTITADLAPTAPNGLRPTGTVQFYLNDTPYGSPIPIISGGAGFSTAALPAGTNVIRATYAGDSNCFGSTNSLVQIVDPNAVNPVALGITVSKSGTVTVTFSGAPGSNYVVQACAGMVAPAWEDVSTNTADAQGHWTFSETPGGLQPRYYRAATP